MSRLQSRQSHALRQLHDISDYSQYIDQRIAKLNTIYQSLSLHKDPKSRNTRTKHTIHVQKPSTMSNRYQISLQPADIKQKLNKLQKMYNTEYINREMPGFYKTEDQLQESTELKSLNHSVFNRTLQIPIKTTYKRDQNNLIKKLKNQKKLSMYEAAKHQILQTFYIGGRSFSRKERKNPYVYTTQQEYLPSLTSIEVKNKKGKLWAGRPPVKIIQTFS